MLIIANKIDMVILPLIFIWNGMEISGCFTSKVVSK